MSIDLMTRRGWTDINKSVIRDTSMKSSASNLLDWVSSVSKNKPNIFWCDNLELPIYKVNINGHGCYAISTPTGYIPYSTDLKAYKDYMNK